MKILTDIPGFESRKLYCIDSSDDHAKVFYAGKLIRELRSKYGRSVAYFSTRGTAKDIECLQENHTGMVGNLYAEDLEDKDVDKLYERAAEMIEKKFVRAIIIDCLEGLDLDSQNYNGGIRAKRNEIKTRLYMLAACNNVPVLLFCPYRKFCKYDNGINPILANTIL